MSNISESKTNLSLEEKRALLARLLQEEAGRAQTFPLSFAQQRLWFLHQLEPDSPVYNVPVAVRLTGQLNVAVLKKSLNEIIQRHEVLRTTFETSEGQPVQVVSPTLSLPLPRVNLQTCPESKREAEAQRLAREEVQRPFDLAQGPLLRATLWQLAEEEHLLLLVVHHIVFDAWSRGVFIHELFTLYQAFAGGEPAPLPELPVQYVDFAHWQRQWAQGEIMESQLAYWRQQLVEAPPVLELPTDRPRPPSQTYRGSVERFQLDSDLVQKLKTLGQQSGATLFMTLLAAFAALLARYSGQKDIVVGSPVAARNRAELEPLIGFFVNTLVLRTDLSGDPTFGELLKRVRQAALGAYAHQDIPFEQLVDALQTERSLSYAPLFQVMFVFQNVPDTALTSLEVPGLTLSLAQVETGTAKFDLSLSLQENETGIAGALEYNTDLFETATIARLVGHFQTLLAGMVTNPHQRLSELPLLTAAERQQLLVEWNDTGTECLQHQCVCMLFEAQVERRPEAIAVIFEGEQLTYRELNRRANQLAHYLRAVGVGPEIPVGVWLERSPEAIVALLSILKAGGVYVPFDPTYPRERLAFMLADARIPVLLTRQGLTENLPQHNARVICLDGEGVTIEPACIENLTPEVMVDNLAYIIYTSGSTGRPKGVLVTHRGLCNLVQAQIRAFELEPGRRVLQFAPLNFDASISEIFTTLLAGATLCLARQDELLPGPTLAALLRDLKITTITLPPSVLAVLPATEFPALRTIISAGEECSADIVARWAPDRTFLNAYGPTEATVCATFTVCTDASRKPPIGRPIDNTQVYILDTHLQPAPIGVPGELYLTGVGLARGYLNQPELTAEKFIPNPFTPPYSPPTSGGGKEGGATSGGGIKGGDRLYKTGDLARYLPDGNIEFLGRIDQQIKLRGFRIELAGIEAVLAEHPLVQEAVVTVQEIGPVAGRQAAPGDKRLVAYYVPAQEPGPTLTELRNFLKQKLPDYMLPSIFMRLEAIPLLPNGKVNRRALPAPDTNRPELAETYAAPRNLEEETLAGIWAGVLGLDHVGIHDNFFELGGHSLQAVQLVSKMSTALGRNLSVKLIFSHPTIAALVNALGSLPSSNDQAVPKAAIPGMSWWPPSNSPQRGENQPTSPPLGPVLSAVEGGIEGGLSAISPSDRASPPASSLLKIEGRSLLSLLATGKIEPVGAASLGYLTRADFTRPDVIQDWFDNLPVCTRLIETSLGRVAVLLLPRFDVELYADENDLVGVIIEALKMAKHLGAKTVSLTGLIPSATDYGRAITSAVTDQPDLPAVSTGHATTTATVVMTIEKTLAESGRDLAQERVGVLGLGSIGTSSLRLMLKSLPHPPEIILCDLYRNLDVLEKIKREIITDLGFQGTVRLVKSQTQTEVPPEFYEASLMIGATNVPDVLDITRVKSGTMMVDDSGPHCFNTELAVQRFEAQADILFTEGGVLKSPQPISELRYVPKEAAQNPNLAELEVVLSRGLRHNPFNITACTFSSLLSACFEELKPTVGLVEVETSLQHYEKLKQLGFQAADLHCRDYTLAEGAVRDFRRRFGK